MKSSTMARGQVYSIGNYLMTGKILGKGHFARVEEATHRTVGKKVAIKIIDLTCIKEDYARRNLHREPRVMARLRHPCIAALYETMMHGPRLYVVMEAAGGGDLCAHVLSARGPSRGLSEIRARALAAQLVSAVKHMHARGVVHRDLKMENIMLDTTKQFIKIVDFGLSNLWSSGGALRTPCGSLEYAAPELFVDGRRYGPEVDLWSIGVIVYGMVTGGLPFTSNDSAGEGKSKPQLRAAISRGFSKKQKAALYCMSNECKTFIEHLLEPSVELRMKIEEASRHRWVRRPGMKLKTHPFSTVEQKLNREIYRQISELSGLPVVDVIAQIKSDPFGATGGIYNIKTHLHQMQAVPGVDLLWSSNLDSRAVSPPPYEPKHEFKETSPSSSKAATPTQTKQTNGSNSRSNAVNLLAQRLHTRITNSTKPITPPTLVSQKRESGIRSLMNSVTQSKPFAHRTPVQSPESSKSDQTPRFSGSRPHSGYGLKKPAFRCIQEDGDCCWDPRLPSIDEHSKPDLNINVTNKFKDAKAKPVVRTPCVRRTSMDESFLRINSCPSKGGESKRVDFYRRAGDCLPNWTGSSVAPNPARLLLQSKATTIKRASLGNIVSPHSSTNSHCKSEKSMPVGWYSTRSAVNKEPTHLQRFRRSAPMK